MSGNDWIYLKGIADHLFYLVGIADDLERTADALEAIAKSLEAIAYPQQTVTFEELSFTEEVCGFPNCPKRLVDDIERKSGLCNGHQPDEWGVLDEECECNYGYCEAHARAYAAERSISDAAE